MVFPGCSPDLNSFSVMKQLDAEPPAPRRDLRAGGIYLFILVKKKVCKKQR